MNFSMGKVDLKLREFYFLIWKDKIVLLWEPKNLLTCLPNGDFW